MHDSLNETPPTHNSPGVTSRLKQRSPSYIFKGFLNTVGGQHLYRQFCFGDAQLVENQPGAPKSASRAPTVNTGSVKVELFSAVEVPKAHYHSNIRAKPATPAGLIDGRQCY